MSSSYTKGSERNGVFRRMLKRGKQQKGHSEAPTESTARRSADRRWASSILRKCEAQQSNSTDIISQSNASDCSRSCSVASTTAEEVPTVSPATEASRSKGVTFDDAVDFKTKTTRPKRQPRKPLPKSTFKMIEPPSSRSRASRLSYSMESTYMSAL